MKEDGRWTSLGNWNAKRSSGVAHTEVFGPAFSGRGSRVVKISDRGWPCHVSSSPVPLKTRRVGKRCTLNLCRELKRPPIGVIWKLGEGVGVPAHVLSTSLDQGRS
ncbi:hypothetical protein TNCV_1431331 [Trichonephila clavipes]|nr:hypothetical protein TNCV_1431331 [Trichonephila clavipes]